MKNPPNRPSQAQPHSAAQLTYIVADPYVDRDRLYPQYELFRPDFNRWFDRALKLGELSTDPENASWRALDAGCGEGLFSYEVSTRYPRACVIGFDRDKIAILTADGAFARYYTRDDINKGYRHFFTYDVLKPLPEQVSFVNYYGEDEEYIDDEPAHDEGFDVVFAHLLLMHVREPAQALANLAAVLKPGGVVYLRDSPTDPLPFPHPSMVALFAAASEAMKRLTYANFAYQHETVLAKAGFTDIESGTEDYIVGGPTKDGQRMLTNFLTGLKSAREALVDILRIIEADEFDEHMRRLETEVTPEMTCQWTLVNTIARKPA